MNSSEERTVAEQLNHEISTLEARLEEISSAADQRSRYATSYLRNALARRSARLDAITSTDDIDQRR